MNALDSLLSHFSLHAGVFYTGNICGRHDFEMDPMRGHLHVIKQGVVELIGAKREKFEVTEPTLIFLPRPDVHRLVADSLAGAEVVCGTVFFDAGGGNPITDSLPDWVLIKLSETQGIEQLLDLMFEEAFNQDDGKQAALDRLCEILIIRLLRHCITQGLAAGGTLAGLSDSRISKALQAIHAEPAHPWTLEEMAKTAGMSRARFAVHFKALTGTTPANYLTSWRLMLAQKLMKKGLVLKLIATEVGYGSSSALARAFSRALGCAPLEWLHSQQKAEGAS
jgi:AraC-like DNA-binding protein